jgi:hypothetical protein
MFTTPSTLEKWFPAIIKHPFIFLSSTCLVSTWLDMQQDFPGDSPRTIMVKAETYGVIKDRLHDTKIANDDTTIMGVLHILAGEMWDGCGKRLNMHIKAAAALIANRGGLNRLSSQNQTLAEVTVRYALDAPSTAPRSSADVSSTCCHHYILFEKQPSALFHSLKPAGPSDSPRVLESPIFCPSNKFRTIRASQLCSKPTFRLLCDMRKLTTDFLKGPTSPTGSRSMPFATSMKRWARLPSAHAPDLATTNDWVYEACRIASLLYAAAIVQRVHFSTCMHNHHDLVSNGLIPATAHANLVEQLFGALQLCDTHRVWGSMAGVLYWITSVGAAAARVPQADRTSHQARIQRYLTMYSVRTMILLIFEYPASILQAQKTLLQVQSRLESGIGQATAVL